MQLSPAWILRLSLIALFGTALGACGSSSPAVTDAGTDHLAEHPATEAGKDGVAADGPRDTPANMTDTGQDLPADMGNALCMGIAPAGNLIADFESGAGAAFGIPGVTNQVVGGTYATDVTTVQDFSANSWHLTAPLSGDQHFGIYWQCSTPTTSGGCTLDASQWKGIQFTIKGYAGPDDAITFSLGRAQNDTPQANAMCGSCVAPADASVGDSCLGPRAIVPLLPDPNAVKTVSLLWTDFSGGAPFDSIDPHQLTGMLWLFHPIPPPDGSADGGDFDAGDGSVPMADIVVDDIKFIPY
jgi:hypothetical protein